MKGCIYSVSKGLKSTSSQSQTKQTQMQPQKPSLQSPNGPKGRAELVKAQTPSIVSRAKQCPQKHVQWFQWLNLTSLWGQGLPAGSDPLCLHLVLSTFLLCSSHAVLSLKSTRHTPAPGPLHFLCPHNSLPLPLHVFVGRSMYKTVTFSLLHSLLCFWQDHLHPPHLLNNCLLNLFNVYR